MRASIQQAVERAIETLPKRNAFKTSSDEFEVHTLFPVQSWKPHTEPCRQAGSLVLGEDSCGNFFLYAPDGSVSFWAHETDETVLAASVEEFCESLDEGTPVVLRPEQVEKVGIDPDFLAEQKRKGNAQQCCSEPGHRVLVAIHGPGSGRYACSFAFKQAAPSRPAATSAVRLRAYEGNRRFPFPYSAAFCRPFIIDANGTVPLGSCVDMRQNSC